MSEKRRDSKGRVLRNGESQRSDGKYMFRYTDGTGERHTVYSWKLVSTDKLKEGQRDSQALRDMEKRILKDLDDSIKTRDAEHTTVDDLFDQFMDIRKDLRESSRCCYNDIYRKHIKPVIGHRPIGRVKPTEIQNNGQVYTQSFVYDTIQGITTSYNKEEYAKALEEKREPCYLPKISAHILRHTFCTRMYEQNINIKVLQDVMGHRNIRTTMETYAKAFRDKKVEAVIALNGAFKIS